MKRSEFKWETNPLLTEIRVQGNEIFQRITTKNKIWGITEADLAIQTMIHLAGLSSYRVWKGKKEMVLKIANNIKLRSTDKARELLN